MFVVMTAPASFIIIFIFPVIWQICESSNISVVYCSAPDYPVRGRYVPEKEFYDVGSFVYYRCDRYFLMSGSHIRRCEDTGDWSGDTPFCDMYREFSIVNQTSTAEPKEENKAWRAVGYLRVHCSQTLEGPGQYWMGIFDEPTKLLNVAIFLPYGYASYQVTALKKDGTQVSIGTKIGEIESLDWNIYWVPEPNTDVIGVKIQSLSETNPLKLCEVRTHFTKTPVCADPHLRIPNGRLQIERTHAYLNCRDGYENDPRILHLTQYPDPNKLTCIRNGVWSRKNFLCIKKKTEE